MTLGEFIDWCSNNNVKEDTPIFLEAGKEVFVEVSHCVADATAVIMYQKWEEEIKHENHSSEIDSDTESV